MTLLPLIVLGASPFIGGGFGLLVGFVSTREDNAWGLGRWLGLVCPALLAVAGAWFVGSRVPLSGPEWTWVLVAMGGTFIGYLAGVFSGWFLAADQGLGFGLASDRRPNLRVVPGGGGGFSLADAARFRFRRKA